jgi:hypothetical protein
VQKSAFQIPHYSRDIGVHAKVTHQTRPDRRKLSARRKIRTQRYNEANSME